MQQLMVCLENIRSVYNVGSVFRSCDGAGVDHLFLTGYTAVPPHPKLAKTALGSIESVSWSHLCDVGDVILGLQRNEVTIVAMEPGEGVGSIYDYELSGATCLFFGHEETGLTDLVLSEADVRLEVPMLGMKDSLNIAVATGVSVYEFRRKLGSFR